MMKRVLLYLFSCGLLVVTMTPSHALYPDLTGIGSCEFINPFAGTPDCVQYTGSTWNDTTAAADCGVLFSFPYTYNYIPGGTCAVPNHAADCVENLGTADEKVNQNNATVPGFCNTLNGICTSVLFGDYFPVAGGICDTGPPPFDCGNLEPEACVAMDSNDDVDVARETNFIGFTPVTASRRPTSVVFFPGAAVTPEAYAPLGQELARNGVYVAVLNGPNGNFVAEVMNDANNVGVVDWALAGHSLGGVTAVKYIDDNPGTISGLALLASFPDVVDDLSSTGIKAVSIYGTNDLISSQSEVLGGYPLLPAETLFVKIRGGNHAQFGFYGAQTGDGDPTIPASKQLELTAATIRHMVARVESGVPDNIPNDGRTMLNVFTNRFGARYTFLNTSGFGYAGIPFQEIDVLQTASRPEFVASKPDTTPGSSPEIRITQFINQLGNADDINWPPVYDGEIQSKFLSQERVAVDLGLTTPNPQGSCIDAHREAVIFTQFLQDMYGNLGAADQVKLAQWTWNYLPDVLFPTGPDFIADESAVVDVTIDELAKTVTVQAPSFFATLDPANGAAAGRHYCKTLSYERIFLIMLDVIARTP